MIDKVKFDGISEDKLTLLEEPTFNNIIKTSISASDGVVIASNELPEDILKHIEQEKKETLEFVNKDEFANPYLSFYDKILG